MTGSRIGLAVGLTVLALPSLVFGQAATLEGIGMAKDGDDILFGDVSVRLNGVAAPEQDSVDGPAATNFLSSLVDGNKVTCRLDGTRANGRPVGVCFVKGVDVGQALIEAGFARDCPRYSGGRYLEAEKSAVLTGKDLSATYPLPGYCEPR
jgi:endonuclease YncB( thermonuclease family)